MKNYLLTLILLITAVSPLAASGSEPQINTPFASVGINCNLGLTDMYVHISDDSVRETDKYGILLGGGLLAEKMFSGFFGLGSGFQYRFFEKGLIMIDTATLSRNDIIWSFQSFNLPFYMIFSLAGESVSLNFQLGFVYSYIFYSHMKTDDPTTSGITEDNGLRFTNSNQVGIMAGLNIKIAITDYTDLMLGIVAEGYPTNLIEVNQGSDRINLFNCSAIAAWMFRTNLFSR